MRKPTNLILAAIIALSSALALQAAEASAQAKVLKISGTSAQVQMPGGESRALILDESLPQGATIITGDGTEVYIQPMSGAVATIKPNSNVVIEQLSLTTEGSAVTKQSALLNLKSGNLVSSLDPAKKSINNYGVRTPKGVAAASPPTLSVHLSAAISGIDAR